MTTGYITHPSCLEHSNGKLHPERPQRIQAIEEELVNSGFFSHLKHYEAPEASQEQLLRVHSPEQIAHITNNVPQDGVISLDNEVCLSPFSYNAALHAAGAVVEAVDLVMNKEVDNVFCCVRPPGHHATKNVSMGFCIFNNIAVGAAHALENYGLKRIAILDFDVHHGNGTEDIFRNDPRVMFCSTFQYPFYPGNRITKKSKNIVDVPIELGGGKEELRDAVNNHWLPALKKFKPEMIFISAGFDAHQYDNIANLNFKRSDYAWLTKTIKAFAGKYSQGRIVSVLEGGYDLRALAESVLVHIKVLRGDDNIELSFPCCWKSSEGAMFTLRELSPSDIEKLADFTNNLSFRARYYRFGDGNHVPSHAELMKVCTPDKDNLLHLIVTIDHGHEEAIVGSLRCVMNHKKKECEFTLVVADDWTKQGIALKLLESVIHLMKSKGIRKIRARVLDTNSKMLHFLDQMGFKVKDSPKGKWMKIATLTLD